MLKNMKIPYIKIMPITALISAILFISSIGLSIYKISNNEYNLGIDFAGGVELKVKIEQEEVINIASIRTLYNDFFTGVNIQELEGENNKNSFLLRFKGDNEDALSALSVLTSEYGEGSVLFLGNTIISGVVSSDNLRTAFFLLIAAWIVMMVYITIRFDIRYALPAIMTLIHNIVIVFAILLLLDKEFTVLILSALLTLIGYTINDTIVVFDRIRENTNSMTTSTFKDIVNVSLNQVLGRTIITSVSTLIAASAIMIWGGSTLYNFAFTFFIGVVIGTYSSNFIASNLLIFMFRKNR